MTKVHPICLVVVTLTSVLGGCATTTPATPTSTVAAKPLAEVSDKPLTGSSATITVHGLACPLCAKGVDAELRKIPGMKTVEVDLGTGIVKVTFDPATPPSRKALSDAVRWGGGTFIELRQP